MRSIETIVFPDFRVSIFSMNEKYLVKLEAGPYEQTYKINHDEVDGLEDLKMKLNGIFQQEAGSVFRSMHAVWQKAIG